MGDEADWWRGECKGKTGVFPSNYVEPLKLSSGGPGEKKRRDLIEELYKTEELFVENLKLVYEVKQKERFVPF